MNLSATLRQTLREAQPAALVGSVVETTGHLATVADLSAPVGALVEILGDAGASSIEAEVVGFRGRLTMISPFSNLAGVRRGRKVRLIRTSRSLRVGSGLLGRVVNAHGVAIDGRARPVTDRRVPIHADPLSPIDRPRIDAPLTTGVRAIDAMLTCGRGQRLGIFAGSGVGKSTLLGMMARYSSAEVIVIGLVGERGREVNEFLERDLGPEGIARSVVVVATSDEPAIVRLQAASTATSIAESFRDQGKDVLLVIDSITRTALASREIGLAAGEPPTTRGYPPSTFALLPRIVERAGRTPAGSITAFYSVLVEGDDPNEPIADAMRGLLDGHVWLSRKLASQGSFPAIDPLESLSRLMPEVAAPEHVAAAQLIRRLLSSLEENEDLISIGAYRQGTNPVIDTAIGLRSEIEQLLRQKVSEETSLEESVAQLMALGQKAASMIATPVGSTPVQTTNVAKANETQAPTTT